MSKKMLSEIAYHTLREEISKMKSGSYLSARQYAKNLGMSYTPVRDAFLRLQKEGMLNQVPNVGFFVVDISIKDLLQLYQVRECLEPFTLEKTFYKFADEHIAKMRKCIREQELAFEKGDSYQFYVWDTEFHGVQFELLGNSKLTELYESMRNTYLLCSSRIFTSDDRSIIEDHRKLVEFIEKKDLDAAIEMTNRHINAMKTRTMENYFTGIL